MPTKNYSDAVSADFGIFGLPTTESEAKLVLFPVPWEVTTSYGLGAADGPSLIRKASEQIDLFDLETKNAFEAGYFMRDIPSSLLRKNSEMKAKAQAAISLLMNQSADAAKVSSIQAEVNRECRAMTEWVYAETKSLLKKGKLVGLVGGDHSTPLGYIRALSEARNGEFGILHFDAHADLRKSYQGFEQSHASIMYNVMHSEFAPKKLVQVGIRDFCEDEYQIIHESQGRIKTFFDIDLKRRLLGGEAWAKLASEIIEELPNDVYVSFDIDGLDPALCPHTGTPVAGGLSINEAFYLLREVVDSGRKIIGFDLNEVSSGGDVETAEWDGNVGARILYKLCGWTVSSSLK